MASDLILNELGALVYVALGVLLLVVRGEAAANRAFAAFGICAGLALALDNLMGPVLPHTAAGWSVAAALYAGAAAGCVALALVLPHAPRAHERRAIAGAGTAAGLFALFAIATRVREGAAVAQAAGIGPGVVAAYTAQGCAYLLMFAAFVFLLLLLAHRYQGAADDAARRDVALVAGAVALYAAYGLGHGTGVAGAIGLGTPYARDLSIAGLVAVSAAAGAWLRASARSTRARAARDVALLIAGAGLLGALGGAIGLASGFGIGRTLCVAVLGYAILRHQLLGIDVKVRWGLSRTSVAAVFIAVFFIASETAQQFFGQRLQNEYVGIAAAGALVLVIAPLQRAADRLAQRMLPVAETGRADPRAQYAWAVRLALADGRVDPREEEMLAALADTLGISASEALALRREAQDAPG